MHACIQALREKLGPAGFTLAFIALIFAVAGGAYAAAGFTKAQEKQIAKIAKKYAGKPGANGTPGAPGANGKDGTNGTDGVDGASVTSSVEPKGVKCKEGGTKFTSASPELSYACNGEKGKEGSPWTAGGTLPSEATETGVWSSGFFGESSLIQRISFNVPLASVPTAVVVGKSAEDKTKGEGEGCPGVVSGIPQAEPGKLCLYIGVGPGTSSSLPPTSTSVNTAQTGALIQSACEPGCIFQGAWAVTAP